MCPLLFNNNHFKTILFGELLQNILLVGLSHFHNFFQIYREFGTSEGQLRMKHKERGPSLFPKFKSKSYIQLLTKAKKCKFTEFRVNDKHEDNYLALGTTVLKNKIIPNPHSSENKEMASFLLQKKRLH